MKLLLLVLLACSAGGDTGESDADVNKAPFTCELGTRIDESDFQPFATGATFELQMGFQGFLLVKVVARGGDDAPSVADARMAVTIEGAEPVIGAQPSVDLTNGVSDEILIFFTSNYLSWFVGRAAEITVRLEDDDQVCVAQATGTLVDEDPCIHTGAEPICPEDTGP